MCSFVGLNLVQWPHSELQVMWCHLPDKSTTSDCGATKKVSHVKHSKRTLSLHVSHCIAASRHLSHQHITFVTFMTGGNQPGMRKPEKPFRRLRRMSKFHKPPNRVLRGRPLLLCLHLNRLNFLTLFPYLKSMMQHCWYAQTNLSRMPTGSIKYRRNSMKLCLQPNYRLPYCVNLISAEIVLIDWLPV